MSDYKPRYKEEIQVDQKTKLAKYAVIGPKDKSRIYEEDSSNIATRGEFQRDRDRIIHSKAFRRLLYKTQVFVNHEGDHFRTRLTHSLEVSQISRGIARSLNVNEDLAEAIALGHDLGHTPFGHAVESLLEEFLHNEGGFLHNQQSVRVVELLEEKIGIPFGFGLNLTSEVREGIFKHTNDKSGIFESLEPEKPCHIEGQIVHFSDKIAYITHDFEDGLNSGIFDELIKNGLISREEIDNIWEMFGADPKWGISSLINRLVVDFVEGSIEKLTELNPQSVEEVKNYKQKILCFKNHESNYNYFKKFVEKHVYGSPLASVMDTKAKRIVHRIYNAYSKNPEQLPYDIYAKFKHPEKYPKRDGYYTTPYRILCDFIAGMTDRYAILTYNKLFNPSERIIYI